jgi:hypothetical protein
MSKSRFLKFKNTQFTDYFEVRTNRVLSIDDISDKFSNSNDAIEEEFSTNILDLNENLDFNRFLVQIKDTTNEFNQLTEIISIGKNDNIVDVIKSSITTDESLDSFADISVEYDSLGNKYLKFIPENDLDYIYDIKILNSTFTSLNSGIGSTDLGFVSIQSFSDSVNSNTTKNILSVNKNTHSSLFLSINLVGKNTEYNNYIKLYIYNDENDIHVSELYSDDFIGLNREIVGFITSYVQGDQIKVDYNSDEFEMYVRSKTILFGDINSGIQTYRFLSDNQPETSERSAIYDCGINTTNSYSDLDSNSYDVFSMNYNLFTSSKSLVEVGLGKTTSLHEIMIIHDGTNININQYPFLSVGDVNELGIGTFGAVYNGNNLLVKFYPDINYSTETFKILSFNEKIYTSLDDENIPNELSYFPVSENITTFKFYGKNVVGFDETSFELKSDGIPIFTKTFNPQNSLVLNKETGVFNIKNHFFSNLERLIYTPKSTFENISESPVGIGLTLNSSGILTNKLPEEVYVIKISPDQFKLSTRKDYAQVGIHVTFTSDGEGNAHVLEMYEKNSKTLITIDDIVQYPLLWTPINYNLENNGGQVGIADTVLCLSGISTLSPKDVVKINDEYMYITNVGFGTSSSGPISFAGTFPLIEVERSFVGSTLSTHFDGDIARLYRGSYNIVKNEIHFTEPPRGLVFQNNEELYSLENEKSSFNGRVFLRSDYSSNIIYDDIRDKFTGFDSDYQITVQGINTTGLGVSGGNGFLLINGIFQTPTTLNNSGNNFEIIEDLNLGITTVSFTGITSSNGEILISTDDINQNQLPRGGLIVSVGSSGGLGYAPLVGASVTCVLVGGVIQQITTNEEFGSYGSGYREPVSIQVFDPQHTGTDAVIDVSVGAGGTLAFNITNGGTGYVNPEIIIEPPTYNNLPIIGFSRLGIGETTETGINLLVDVEVGASSTSGIGSTTFSVVGFKISRNGYGFKKGDVFRPVGLVTAKGLSSPIEEFTLSVEETFTDSFGLWNFGTLNYIDSIKNYQDGIRKSFPLFYNSQLISFTKNNSNQDSQLIDLKNVLVIFINGILQTPGISYEFDGGSSFSFIEAPDREDNIDIFFYIGTENVDSVLVNIDETLKIGDSVQVFSSNETDLINITVPQDPRIIANFDTIDVIETPTYSGLGIDNINYKPTSWIKQKRDLFYNGEIISKSRDSIESQIYPTSRLIKNFSSNDSEIFLDNVELFKYDNPLENNFDLIIIDEKQSQSNAEIEFTVSNSGTINGFNINNQGNGYVGPSINLIVEKPVGEGIKAEANATVSSNGQINNVTITNPGSGYTSTNPPKVLIPNSPTKTLNVLNISSIEGFASNIVGISTTTGVGTPLAIRFEIDPNTAGIADLQPGYYIYVSETNVGNGVTSINLNNSDIIGISTSSVDNIYIVHSSSGVGIITCNILSDTNTIGIQSFSTNNIPVGKISWGRLSNFIVDQSEIIQFNVKSNVISGLSTYPLIQRRGFGLRNTGSIKKSFSS